MVTLEPQLKPLMVTSMGTENGLLIETNSPIFAVVVSTSPVMSSPFVKLNGVRALNVAKRAAHHIPTVCPRRHHVWRACVVVSSLIALARAGAGVWARWGGGGFSFAFHACSVPTGRPAFHPCFLKVWL